MEAVAEARVLHRDGDLRGVGVEVAQVVDLEGAPVAQSIGNDQCSEERALTVEESRHGIPESLLDQPPAKLWVPR